MQCSEAEHYEILHIRSDIMTVTPEGYLLYSYILRMNYLKTRVLMTAQ
jgi:hypothetical protein